jgi:hypothetical protein
MFGGLSTQFPLSRARTNTCSNRRPGDSRVRTNGPRTARRLPSQSARSFALGI